MTEKTAERRRRRASLSSRPPCRRACGSRRSPHGPRTPRSTLPHPVPKPPAADASARVLAAICASVGSATPSVSSATSTVQRHASKALLPPNMRPLRRISTCERHGSGNTPEKVLPLGFMLRPQMGHAAERVRGGSLCRLPLVHGKRSREEPPLGLHQRGPCPLFGQTTPAQATSPGARIAAAPDAGEATGEQTGADSAPCPALREHRARRWRRARDLVPASLYYEGAKREEAAGACKAHCAEGDGEAGSKHLVPSDAGPSRHLGAVGGRDRGRRHPDLKPLQAAFESPLIPDKSAAV